MPAAGLLSPLWIYYRRMQFVRQRALQAIDPSVSFVVTVALAIAGAGYWALVIGAVAGTWTAALVTLATSPYRPRLRLGSPRPLPTRTRPQPTPGPARPSRHSARRRCGAPGPRHRLAS